MIGRPTDHSSKLARGELSDSEAAERLEAEHPDAFMRRRDFLARAAVLAGTASLATVLPADTLVAEAARHGLRTLPSPRNVPINTFVVLMMENRSFDHYFGWYPNADGKNAGLHYPDANGHQVATHHLTSDFQGCDFRDPNHSWDGGRHQYDKGKMDGFVQGTADGTGSDSFAAGYYLKKDIPFLPYAAQAYTLYDRWFCSIMDSTYPNRHYQWGAQDGGTMGNKLPPQTPQRTGFTWETIFDRAKAHHLTARYYASDVPFAALYGTARPRMDASGLAVLRRRGGRQAAQHRLRRPRVPRRGPGDLRRRASARRHPPGTGLHVRRRPRLHALASIPARRVVHRLRRVGRVLRARQAALRP